MCIIQGCAAQRSSLLAHLRENAQVLDARIARITLPTIYRASTGMGCAFAHTMAQLYDDPTLAEPYRPTNVWDLGNELLGMLEQERDDVDGDVLLVDRWAERLDLRGWYWWERLETLPPAETTISA